MASTSLPYSPILSLKLLSQTIKPNKRMRVCTKTYVMRRNAHDHDHDQDHHHNYRGGLVDQNLIVLRKRIHETEMMEGNYEPPSEWMDWEKRFYTSYDSIICDAMGWLQSYLMETRPSIALAMILLIILSVPTSTALAVFHLLQLTKGIY